jgi:pimeloyl-ACP methyl ester carboxylesterase
MPSLAHTVSSRDAELYTEAVGSGPLLVLVHGWTLDHRSFDLQVESLAARFKVVSLDRRSCGQSTGKPDLWTELDDLDAVINAYGGGSAHLLGVSQGGRLALRYAATRPQRVRSLILQGAVLDGYDAPDAPGESVPLAHFRELVSRGDIDQMRREWLLHPLMRRGIGSAGQRALLKAMVSDYQGQDLIAAPTPDRDVDVAALLSAQSIPTLIVTGSLETEARKQHAAHLLSVLSGSAEVVIEGAGHLSNLSHASRYNALVLEFCCAIERRRGG